MYVLSVPAIEQKNIYEQKLLALKLVSCVLILVDFVDKIDSLFAFVYVFSTIPLNDKDCENYDCNSDLE